MTSSSVKRFEFTAGHLATWAKAHPHHGKWPVVYVLTSDEEVYVGESLTVARRIRQHMSSKTRGHLSWVHVIHDDTFNKSACLDLESFLIKRFAGDGHLRVLNRNAGITDADYYDRQQYQETFEGIFRKLRRKRLFHGKREDIEKSSYFKLSPFKALNDDQAIAVEGIVRDLFADLASGRSSTAVVQGDPGTGKTIVAIYLLKLLQDIKAHDTEEPLDGESVFDAFFTPERVRALASLQVGIVVPQQSLRASLKRVFKDTPGLSEVPVLSPDEVGNWETPLDEVENRETPFDLLVVEEAHRLAQRANRGAGPLNTKFGEINQKLFGKDDPELTQLDWIRKQSRHTVLIVDPKQTVRPADLNEQTVTALLHKARADERFYRLRSQMRISDAQDYVEYVRRVLSDDPPKSPKRFDGYDIRFFTDLNEMRDEILALDKKPGLARLVAGYAWKWPSLKDKSAIDIELDGVKLRWNSSKTDWIAKPKSVDEVGSIHTVQGYDLNYAGVIIGQDLRYDPVAGRIVFDRSQYHDRKGHENNRQRGIFYTDDEILEYVRNIYAVLLTRGMKGTFVYVCDPALRDHLEPYFRAGP